MFLHVIGFFSRSFNIDQHLTYYLSERDLILNMLFLLSAVIPALKDNIGLKLSNVKIISDLKNNVFERVF